MRPFLHPILVNGRSGDPAPYIETLFERRAIMFDLGDISNLSPRKIQRLEHVFVSRAHIDHLIGFDHLLRVLVGRDKKIALYGPNGFIDHVHHKLFAYRWNLIDRFMVDPVFVVTEIESDLATRTARLRLKNAFAVEAADDSRLIDDILYASGFFRLWRHSQPWTMPNLPPIPLNRSSCLPNMNRILFSERSEFCCRLGSAAHSPVRVSFGRMESMGSMGSMESKGAEEGRPGTGNLKVISWNLLRLTGAGVEDVAALIERYRPDLLLLQEATDELAELPARVGGCFFREPLDGRIYGLAVWSPHPLARPYALPLPVSQVPGRVPPRVAQIVQLGDVAFANVHLSHGQFLNRWQLLHIANALDGPAAVVGDYNAIGPIKLAGFKDIGPRQPTHSPSNIISFRLDRCMARGLRCSYARVLARGSSDHHPIRLDLHVLPGVRVSDGSGTAYVRRLMLRASVERWVRAMSDAPNRISVRQTFFETLDLKFRKGKRGKAPRQRSRAHKQQ